MNKTVSLHLSEIEEWFDAISFTAEGNVSAVKNLLYETPKRNYKFTMILEFLTPPIQYPDEYMLMRHKVEGMGSKKYGREMKAQAGAWLTSQVKPKEEVKEISSGYVGVICGKNQNIPILFSPNEKPDIAAEEIRHCCEVRNKNESKMVTTKRTYYKWNGSYYYSEHDPIKYMVSKDQEQIERALLKLANKGPVAVYDYEYREKKTIPFFLYDGVIPCYYFSEQLFFRDEGFGKSFISDGMMQSYNQSENGKFLEPLSNPGFKTANELYREYGQKYQDIRQRVIVYSEELKGSEYPTYEIGEEVEISAPEDSKKELKGKKGYIDNVKGVYAYVKFMNYFVERFHLKEIKRTRQSKEG